MKQCIKCGIEKPLSEFYKESRNKDVHTGACKECVCKRANQWYENNKDRYLLRVYGITEKEFEDKISHQSGRCAICSSIFTSTKHTHIDHNHTTGKVRGLLCSRCNHLLGHAKESLQTLQNAVEYLKYHSS